MDKIALITGANRGLGHEVARQLGQAGLTTLLGSRDLETGRRAADTLRDQGVAAEALQLDVCDPDSVRHAGPVRVLEHFLPLLRESDAGRVVNVSSTMGSLHDQADPGSPYALVVVPGYRASKAALNSLTISVAKLVADTPIKVNAVCPGFVKTDLTPANREQAPLDAADAARVVIRYALAGDGALTGGFFDAEAPVAW